MIVFAVKEDPPVRADGCCVQCGGERHPERAARYARADALADAFCSSSCSRRWHGTELPVPLRTGRPKVASS